MRRFVVWSCLFLAACAPAPEADAVLVEPLIVVRTAGLDSFQEEMLACEGAAAPLVIREMVPGATVGEDVDLTLRWGEPDVYPEYVYAVAEDRLLVVMREEIDLLVTPDDVRAIFSGQIRNWAALGEEDAEIEVWVLMGQNEAAGLFETYVMGDVGVTPNAFLAGTPADILSAIAKNKNAIGYLPASWLTPDMQHVQAVDFDIIQPILALSDSPLSAAAQDWVACLQGN